MKDIIEEAYTTEDFLELLDLISELNMVDEENLVGIDELRELIELVIKIGNKYDYVGPAGMGALNIGIRTYIDMERYKDDKLSTYLSWWVKKQVEIALGIHDPEDEADLEQNS